MADPAKTGLLHPRFARVRNDGRGRRGKNMSTIGKSLIRGAKDALRYAHGQKNNGKTHKIKTNKNNCIVFILGRCLILNHQKYNQDLLGKVY